MPSRVARRRGLTYALAAVLALGATLVGVQPAEAAHASYSAEVLASSPIAYYRLGEPSGTTMFDSSGYGVNGTYTGATLGGPGALAVDPDTSASFNGAGNGTSGIVSGISTYTLEAWVRRSNNADSGIVGQAGGSFLFVYSGQLAFGEGLDIMTGVGPILTPGDWWHVAATWDGTTARMYVNGSQVASNSVIPLGASSPSPLILGNGLAGDLDEVAYYQTALPANVIGRHWLVGHDGTPPDVTVTFPTNKAHVLLHQFTPSYSCVDPPGGVPPVASGIDTCVPAPGIHDLGPHLFSVTGTDNVGNATTSPSVALVVDPPRYGDFVLDSNPLAYYRLDQAVGSTTMVDSSGNGHDGILVNGAVTGSRRNAGVSCEKRPHPPRACEFANDPQGWSTHFGNRGYGYVNDIAAPKTAYTLEAWINPDDPNDASIMGQGGAGQLYLRNGRLALRQTQDDVVSPGPNIPVGDWTHVAATWNGSVTRLFVNGVQVASSNTANKPPSGFATVYVGYGEQAPPFRGSIDEAAYYPTALDTHTLRDHWMIGTAYDHPSLVAGNSPLNTAGPKTDPESPVNNGLYAPGKVPVADFECEDPDGPADIASCTATVDGNPIADGAPLPGSLGVHTFVVTAVDLGGNNYVHPHTYTVKTFADIYRTDNPIVYYRLGDPTGPLMADSSGNGRDGTYKNWQNSGPVGISGDGDRARSFNSFGKEGGYGYSNGASASPYQSTIEAWVNPDDLRDQSIGGLAWSDELYISDGKFVYRHLGDTVTADVGPTPGVFTQVVGVWDGAFLLIYVDGVLHGSGTPAAGLSSAGDGTFYVAFGTQETWFRGSLDEVAYYDIALTPARVYQHFLADPPPPEARPAGCPTCVGLRVSDARGDAGAGRLPAGRHPPPAHYSSDCAATCSPNPCLRTATSTAVARSASPSAADLRKRARSHLFGRFRSTLTSASEGLGRSSLRPEGGGMSDRNAVRRGSGLVLAFALVVHPRDRAARRRGPVGRVRRAATADGDQPAGVVPDVVGYRLARAKNSLAWSNCAVGTTRYRDAAPRMRGRVLAQSIAPGTIITSSRSVRLTVGS